MPWLLVTEEGHSPRVLEITTSPFRMGRRAGNDLVLSDYGASREHSRILQEGPDWRLVDLGAANGTYLNGRRLDPNASEELDAGDEIQIGRAKLLFLEKPPGSEATDPVDAFPPDATRMISADKLPSLARSPDVVRQLETVALPKRVEYFTVLHELAKLLLGARELPQIGRTALDLLFRVLPVERAAIALLGPGGGPPATLVEQARKSDEPVTISQTIASWVLRERVAVITSDARHDPRFQAGAEHPHVPHPLGHVRAALVGQRHPRRHLPRQPLRSPPLHRGRAGAGDGGRQPGRHRHAADPPERAAPRTRRSSAPTCPASTPPTSSR